MCTWCDVWVGHLPCSPTLTLSLVLWFTLTRSLSLIYIRSLSPALVAMVESNELNTAISHVYSLIRSCCPTLFHPHSSLSVGLYIEMSVCLTVLTTVLTVLTIAAVLSTVLFVLSIVLTVLTNVLTVLYRCKPSVPMSKQVLTAVWGMKRLSLQPFSQFLL